MGLVTLTFLAARSLRAATAVIVLVTLATFARISAVIGVAGGSEAVRAWPKVWLATRSPWFMMM